jgi:hypothetical protein
VCGQTQETPAHTQPSDDEIVAVARRFHEARCGHREIDARQCQMRDHAQRRARGQLVAPQILEPELARRHIDAVRQPHDVHAALARGGLRGRSDGGCSYGNAGRRRNGCRRADRRTRCGRAAWRRRVRRECDRRDDGERVAHLRAARGVHLAALGRLLPLPHLQRPGETARILLDGHFQPALCLDSRALASRALASRASVEAGTARPNGSDEALLRGAAARRLIGKPSRRRGSRGETNQHEGSAARGAEKKALPASHIQLMDRAPAP